MDAAYQERLMESRARLFPEFFVKISNAEKAMKNQDIIININPREINVSSEEYRSRSIYKKNIDQDLNIKDPDGLNFEICGQFSKILKEDPKLLLARQWKTSPATLTNALKRMGLEWVHQQIDYVSGRKDLRSPGRYLSVILARNPY